MKQPTKQQVDYYAKLAPEWTRASVKAAVTKMLNTGSGALDAITFDYYMRGTAYGGLGMGRKRR